MELTKEQEQAIELVNNKKYNEYVGELKAYQIIERDNLHEFVGLKSEDKPLWQ